MSDNIVEQAEEKSASKIGKFNTAEDLLSAYNALESEFTKRCQLVKQLQTELNALRAQAEDNARQVTPPENPSEQQNATQAAQPPAENTQPVPEADGGIEQSAPVTIEPVPPTITADDVLNEILQNACEYAERLSAIPEVMGACIASYKQRLIQPHPAPAPSGMAVIVPAKKPRTLQEAKRLAEVILAGN